MLRAAAGSSGVVALAGCGLFGKSSPEPPKQPDALLPLLMQTREMLGRYDAAIAAQPSLTARLTPLRDATAEHATTLAKLIGEPTAAPAPSSSAAPPTSPVQALSDLRAAEQAGQRSATEFCLSAPGERAPLLGSIVAARATHQSVLS